MSTYDKIAWLPLCAGLTGLGLIMSYFAYRRRGPGSGLRWAAWSLLPVAAYLTGSIEMFWKMGVAVGDFAKGFVFSPRVWAGIALAGLAVVLLVVSGPMRRRRVSQGKDARAAEPAAGRAGAVAAGPRPAGAGSWASARVPLDSAACLSWPRPTPRRRIGRDTTNSTTARPASAIPAHTFGENTKPLAKSPTATPIFQNISIEPVR